MKCAITMHNIKKAGKMLQVFFIFTLFFCLAGRCEAGQPKLDEVAVEQTLNAYLTKYRVVKIHGICRESENIATVYFGLNVKGTDKKAHAGLCYLMGKGWFIKRIDYGSGMGHTW